MADIMAIDDEKIVEHVLNIQSIVNNSFCDYVDNVAGTIKQLAQENPDNPYVSQLMEFSTAWQANYNDNVVGESGILAKLGRLADSITQFIKLDEAAAANYAGLGGRPKTVESSGIDELEFEAPPC